MITCCWSLLLVLCFCCEAEVLFYWLWKYRLPEHMYAPLIYTDDASTRCICMYNLRSWAYSLLDKADKEARPRIPRAEQNHPRPSDPYPIQAQKHTICRGLELPRCRPAHAKHTRSPCPCRLHRARWTSCSFQDRICSQFGHHTESRNR